jgi:hypothetical protein
MIHEYRIYDCVPLQLPRLIKRFEEHTFRFWKKHGIRALGFWQVAIGEGYEQLHYILEWESLAQREARWNAFLTDPEWVVIFNRTEGEGAILANIKSVILAPQKMNGAILTYAGAAG